MALPGLSMFNANDAPRARLAFSSSSAGTVADVRELRSFFDPTL